jgi:hypothetical protein
MRAWQFWWRTLVLSTQSNPPEFVEHLMIVGTLILGMRWMLTDEWAYLVLSSSFAIGAAVSMWVRETMMPSHRPRIVLILAVAMLFVYSFYGFADVARYYL